VREPVPIDVFVELTGAPVEHVRSLREQGLLDPDRDGLFDDVDLVRLSLLEHYLREGYTIERLADELRAGDLDPLLGDLLYTDARTYTTEDAAVRSGVDAALLRALFAALGFSEETRLTSDDLELVDGFKLALEAGLPFDGILETARVLGDSMRRIADAETRLVHVHVHERLVASGVDEAEVQDLVFDLQAAFAPMIDPLLVRLHRAHLLDAAIEDAVLHTATASSPASPPGSIEVTIVFVDLASFTTLTESQGDAAAVQILARVDELMRPVVLAHHGKVVKQIGDGFMLAFRDAIDAVQTTIALRELLYEPGIPPIRVGINTGIAIFRGSDYIGSAVNIASRVADAATAGQILLTATTTQRIEAHGIAAQEVGARLLRGVDEPVNLYRVVEVREERDPMCGKIVAMDGALRLANLDGEIFFCSQECLVAYLDRAPTGSDARH
jgi:adenylate cyclase